jgi:hypothetical protein
MYWQTSVPNANEIDESATRLLDALEVLRPCGARPMSAPALGRWIMASGQDGTISDDTVIWLHHLLLPTKGREARTGHVQRIVARKRRPDQPTHR